MSTMKTELMKTNIDFRNDVRINSAGSTSAAPAWRCTPDWAIQCWCGHCSEWVNCNKPMTGQGNWTDIQKERMECPKCGKFDNIVQKNLIFMKCNWKIEFQSNEMTDPIEKKGDAVPDGYMTWKADGTAD